MSLISENQLSIQTHLNLLGTTDITHITLCNSHHLPPSSKCFSVKWLSLYILTMQKHVAMLMPYVLITY